MSHRSLLSVFAAALLLGGAGLMSFRSAEAESAPPQTITATLIGADGSQVGNVQLTQNAAGQVSVIVGVSGLKAGKHGIHIHAVGQCQAPDFASAGGHFNPAAKQHGLNNPQGHHAGDLLAITVEANGTARYEELTTDVTLSAGPNSIFDADGSALVIHADADDQVTDPSGNSGARLACAVLAAPRPASPTAVPKPPTAGGAFGDDDQALDARVAALVALTLAASAGGLLVIRARRSAS